jgi:hypothetical protein
MTKRLLAAYLWIAALWSLGAVVQEWLGLSEYLGLALGIAAAAAIVLMPASLWGRQLLERTSRQRVTVDKLPAGSPVASN